jgi:membrane protease YdiL (CAAX protease family)
MSSLDGTVTYGTLATTAPAFERPAPRPLGVWASLGWALLTSASVFGFLLGLSVQIWNRARPDHAIDLVALLSQHVFILNGVLPLLLAGVIALVCKSAGWRATDYLQLARPQRRYIWLGIAGVLIPFISLIILGALNLKLGAGSGGGGPVSMGQIVLLWVFLVISAPIAEELVIRGFLYRGLADTRLGVVGAIVLSSLIWAALHFDKTWIGVGHLFLCGLVWGFLRWRTNSTFVPIVVHAVYNSLPALFITMAALGKI